MSYQFANSVRVSVIFVFFISIASTLLAEQKEYRTKELVISANRYSTPASKVSSAVTVITADDIERSQAKYVHEILKTVPYLDVIRNGGQGGNVSIFMRAANSEHTLVLVDGIEINNPSTSNRSVNLNNLTIDNIERIEVLRGSQSMLYGSDALGGVISIYTKTGSSKATSTLDLSGGAFNTMRVSAETSAAVKQFNYALAASVEDSEGISAAAKSDGNSERDGYYNSSVSGKFGVKISDAANLNLISRYTRSKSDIDNQGGIGGDDLNRKLTSEQLLLRAETVTNLISTELTQTFGVSWTDHKLKDFNDPDSQSLEFLRSIYDGNLTKFELVNHWQPNSNFNAILGIETEQEKSSSQYHSDGAFGPFTDDFAGQDLRTNSAYLDGVWTIDKNLTLNTGGRYDNNSRSGSEFTYRAGPVVCLNDCATRILSNVGTGYKAPSLFQLYSTYGNRDLEAEESFNWEVGVEQKLVNDDLNVGLTFFRNKIDNLVTFDNQTFIFENIDKARIYGLEAFVVWELSDSWTWRNDYSYTDARNMSDKSFLLRRARNKFSTEISKALLEKKLSLALQLTAFDGRFDNDFAVFPAERVKLPGYALANLNANYQLSDTFDIYGRIENILDKEYQEVLGFGTPGVAAYAGVKAKF